ncbi:MAG: hypothetical protein ND866_20770, partial [Pyrinomonadaceae bacterium]|nr:hypothetical protein [Pyrinomonadaceae bacterium]
QKLPRSLRVKRIYQYDHYRYITNSGAAQLVCNRKELTNAVLQALQEPERQSAARRQLVRLECGSIDGYAGKRLAEALAQVPVSCAKTKPVSATAKALAAALQTELFRL